MDVVGLIAALVLSGLGVGLVSAGLRLRFDVALGLSILVGVFITLLYIIAERS